MTLEDLIQDFAEELGRLNKLYGAAAVDAALEKVIPDYAGQPAIAEPMEQLQEYDLKRRGRDSNLATGVVKTLGKAAKDGVVTSAQAARLAATIPAKAGGAIVSGTGTALGAAGAAGGALATAKLDQDVRIAGQVSDLETRDQELYDLVSKTNSLIDQTNEMLRDMSDAIRGANTELKDLNVGADYIASSISGDSIEDIERRQQAGLPPDAPQDRDEKEAV